MDLSVLSMQNPSSSTLDFWSVSRYDTTAIYQLELLAAPTAALLTDMSLTSSIDLTLVNLKNLLFSPNMYSKYLRKMVSVYQICFTVTRPETLTRSKSDN